MKTFTKRELVIMMVKNHLCKDVPEHIQNNAIEAYLKRMSEDGILEEMKIAGVEFMKVGNNQYQVVPKKNNFTAKPKSKSREFRGYERNSD